MEVSWDVLLLIYMEHCDFKTRISLSKTCIRLRKHFLAQQSERYKIFQATYPLVVITNFVFTTCHVHVDYDILEKVTIFADKCATQYGIHDGDGPFMHGDGPFFFGVFLRHLYEEKIFSTLELRAWCPEHVGSETTAIEKDIVLVMAQLGPTIGYGEVLATLIEEKGDIVNAIMALEKFIKTDL